MSAEPVADAEPALVVEGLSKLYERRSPRWRRILLPWSRVDTGGDDLDDDEDDVDEEEDEPEYPEGEGVWALRDVSFTVARGEAVAIVGTEGAGRETLMRILSGVSLPTAGRALVRGRVGPSPQTVKLLLPGGATARGTLRGVGRAMGASKEHVRRGEAEAFALGGLTPDRDREFRRLPTTAKLRFLFASVLALDPGLLLVEGRPFKREPEVHQQWVDTILAVKAERGIGVILRVEDLDFVEHVADRVLWLEEGRIRAIGPASEVLGDFRATLEREARAHGTGVVGPLGSARIVDAEGERTTDVRAGDDLRVEADVELSALRTRIDCLLELRHEDDHAPDVTRRRWRLESEGETTIRCTVPTAWLRGGQWSGRLQIMTAELHAQRRTARQDLAFTVEGGAGDATAPLDDIAVWTLAELPDLD